MNPYVATVLTFLIAVFFLRLMDFLAHRGILDSRLSRKLIHIGTGPIFVLCWLMFPDLPVSRWLASLVPLVITAQFALVGTGIIKDEAAVKAFLTAFAKGAKEAMANPDAAIEFVKQRDGIINTDLEKRRFRMAIDAVIASPDARTEGFGQIVPGRLALMASQVSDAFSTKTRVNPDTVWNGSFLPSKAELNVLPAAKK